METQYLLGSQHRGPDYTSTKLDGMVLGTSAMNTNKPNNEDSSGMAVLQDGTRLLMVADSHFGYHAGELAIELFPDVMATLSTLPLLDALRTAALIVDHYVSQRAVDRSATTLTVVGERNNERAGVSVGDSYILDGSTVLCPPKIQYLGHHSFLQRSISNYGNQSIPPAESWSRVNALLTEVPFLDNVPIPKEKWQSLLNSHFPIYDLSARPTIICTDGVDLENDVNTRWLRSFWNTDTNASLDTMLKRRHELIQSRPDNVTIGIMP
jgi:serine/threonine protein phosphatase PrpC